MDAVDDGIHAEWRRIDAFRGSIDSGPSGVKSKISLADALRMATVPKRLSDKVAFYQNHLNAFANNAAALGLTLADVADLQAKVDAAREAFTDQ